MEEKDTLFESEISFAFRHLLMFPVKMNLALLGITLALATLSEAQTCSNGGVESANPLGTCGGCEDQVHCLQFLAKSNITDIHLVELCNINMPLMKFQFFMSQDCMTGFACHPDTSNAPLEGCLLV